MSRLVKFHLRAIISTIEVDKNSVPIIGRKSVLSAAFVGKQAGAEYVRGAVRKWRAKAKIANRIYGIEMIN